MLAKAGALNLNTEVINRLPGAFMNYRSACTVVFGWPTTYCVLSTGVLYVCTNSVLSNWTTKSKYDFLLCEMFRPSPAKNDGYQQCLQQCFNKHNNYYYPIQYIGYFLKDRFNSRSAYCKASIKKEIPHTNSTNTQNKTLNRQNKNSTARKKQYKRSTGAENLNPEKK